LRPRVSRFASEMLIFTVNAMSDSSRYLQCKYDCVCGHEQLSYLV
jgi:hypothetical protein